ncbi:hypothetical protein [Streptomyces benahoarensis]|uniref:Uncharacterized protein n=1 Tax=Streptomyces benahoarensis TaxID=2595054 RepID=A0A553Z3R3_9ACTN|nr:hypothetical protein [Streptomyces benahoarensis]TSB18618.1 hypothetical protein FNJ62_23865 [Streptomyces benahoarensis]TSB36044.1 hypothetical protein FNZ23_20255 [Streptomyces benahoarensis]
MQYLRGFIPWLAFGVVSAVGWQWGALAGLALAAAFLLTDRTTGWAPSERLLDYGTVLFFTALTAFAFLRPDSGLKVYAGSLSMGWLALVAWGSIAARSPFTLAIARRRVTPEVAASPLFLRINTVLTAAWALSFTLTALAQAALSFRSGLPGLSVVVQIAGFVLPARFTAAYPEWARARYLRDTVPQHPAQTQGA